MVGDDGVCVESCRYAATHWGMVLPLRGATHWGGGLAATRQLTTSATFNSFISKMEKWSHKKGTPLKNENRVIKVGFWS